MANILYTKLQQAKQEYFTYSNMMFGSFSDSNIDTNISKKISVIAYWLEILEGVIKDCTSVYSTDPSPITYTLNQTMSFIATGDLIEPIPEYLYIRDKEGTLVPVLTLNFLYSGAGAETASFITIANGLGSFNLSNYNNQDSGITVTVTTFSPYQLTISFNNVGDKYNGNSLQSSGHIIGLNSIPVTGGISSDDCIELTPEQMQYYDYILNIISIELGFNYITSELETIEYNTILSINLESGDSIEL